MCPDFSLERSLFGLGEEGYIVGVDEVGRGAMAGAVVAAAMCFDSAVLEEDVEGLDDSKRLSKGKRVKMCEKLKHLHEEGLCYYALGEASVEEIDHMNILQASFCAMVRAVRTLKSQLGTRQIAGILVDGNKSPKFGVNCPVTCVTKGDSKSYSIAGASIVAKVSRDEMMVNLSEKFAGYGWEKNAGYGTKAHLEAMRSFGITPYHRLSFSWDKAFGAEDMDKSGKM